MRNEGEPMANTHTKYYPSYAMTLDSIHMRHNCDSWINFMVNITKVTLMIFFFSRPLDYIAMMYEEESNAHFIECITQVTPNNFIEISGF